MWCRSISNNETRTAASKRCINQRNDEFPARREGRCSIVLTPVITIPPAADDFDSLRSLRGTFQELTRVWRSIIHCAVPRLRNSLSLHWLPLAEFRRSLKTHLFCWGDELGLLLLLERQTNTLTCYFFCACVSLLYIHTVHSTLYRNRCTVWRWYQTDVYTDHRYNALILVSKSAILENESSQVACWFSVGHSCELISTKRIHNCVQAVMSSWHFFRNCLGLIFHKKMSRGGNSFGEMSW